MYENEYGLGQEQMEMDTPMDTSAEENENIAAGGESSETEGGGEGKVKKRRCKGQAPDEPAATPDEEAATSDNPTTAQPDWHSPDSESEYSSTEDTPSDSAPTEDTQTEDVEQHQRVAVFDAVGRTRTEHRQALAMEG